MKRLIYSMVLFLLISLYNFTAFSQSYYAIGQNPNSIENELEKTVLRTSSQFRLDYQSLFESGIQVKNTLDDLNLFSQQFNRKGFVEENCVPAWKGWVDNSNATSPTSLTYSIPPQESTVGRKIGGFFLGALLGAGLGAVLGTSIHEYGDPPGYVVVPTIAGFIAGGICLAIVW